MKSGEKERDTHVNNNVSPYCPRARFVTKNIKILKFIFPGLIEGLSLDGSDGINLQLRMFYDSCMDVDSIRTKGSIPGQSVKYAPRSRRRSNSPTNG